MKKYLRLTCTVCQRSADRLVDNTHFTPDKCTITFRCEGRLIPVQYKSDGGITSAPAVGITDWRARNTVLNTSSKNEEEVIADTSTGETAQIVLAASLSAVPAPGSTMLVSFVQQDNTPKNFKQYVYRSEVSFSTVSGVESGLEKRTLRFGLTDSVQVFLNGVQLENGLLSENFQIYDGSPSSAVPPNTIKFNETLNLPGITQVDVIVSPITSSTPVDLTFTRNESDESRLGTGSWENVDFVEHFDGSGWTKYYLFTLDLGDATALTLNTILTGTSGIVLNGTVNVLPANVKILLARSPFSTLDRYTNLWVPMDTLGADRDYLKYAPVNGVSVLGVTDTSIQTVFPPLKVSKFTVEKTIQTAIAGDSDQIVFDGSSIVGPDA